MDRRRAMQHLIGTGALGALAPAYWPAESTAMAPAGSPLARDQLRFWLETSLRRVYPTSPPSNAGLPTGFTARNARFSFQACFRNDKASSVKVRCEVLGADDWKPVVRRVGFVPLRAFNTFVPADELEGLDYIPGLCPDPLYPEDEDTAHVGPQANGAFWISLFVPPEAEPGVRNLQVRFTLENEFAYVDWTHPKPWSVELAAPVDVCPSVLSPRRDFPVTQWISADSISNAGTRSGRCSGRRKSPPPPTPTASSLSSSCRSSGSSWKKRASSNALFSTAARDITGARSLSRQRGTR